MDKMANYKTHKNIGIISSIFITLSIFILLKFIDITIFKNQYIKIDNNLNIFSILLMIFFGYIGSLFPDIDLSTSKPIQLFKNIIYVSIIILLLLFFDQVKLFLTSLKNVEIEKILNNEFVNIDFIVILLILTIPYFLVHLFFIIINKLTYHRGIIHSIPFAFLLTLLLYLSFYTYYLNKIVIKFELNVFFISILFFIGNIVHLLLDEFYSVDFKNKKIKKSFSTALTIFSFKSSKTYIKLYLIIFIVLLMNFSQNDFNIYSEIIKFFNK